MVEGGGGCAGRDGLQKGGGCKGKGWEPLIYIIQLQMWYMHDTGKFEYILKYGQFGSIVKLLYS